MTAIEGSYEGSDIGTTTNSVIDGTIETTRHADGHISVTGSIWAKTRTVADAVASGNSIWVEGLKFGAGINPPGQGDLLTMSDEALDAAGDGSQSSTGPGSGASGFGDFDRFDVGVVVSRDINAHYVEEDTDIGAAENPSGYVGKAKTVIGDYSKAGHVLAAIGSTIKVQVPPMFCSKSCSYWQEDDFSLTQACELAGFPSAWFVERPLRKSVPASAGRIAAGKGISNALCASWP